tara:strand:- start:39733 stop:40047 length:315 start_codon:yes stop_codon:yes gene_type:complete
MTPKAKKASIEKSRLNNVKSRFLDRNMEAMKFCNDNKLTVYAAAQRNNKVKLFVQHLDKFRLLNNIEYDQYEELEVMEYHAAIDIEYERIWNLKKDINNVNKKK